MSRTQRRLLETVSAVSSALALAWLTSISGGERALLVLSVLALAGLAFRMLRERGRETDNSSAAGARRVVDLRIDAMTGVLVRQVFMAELAEAMRRVRASSMERCTSCSLVLLDLDDFKLLNDSLGHNVGDAALAHLGAVIRESFPGCTIGRLGGDEFAVLIDDAPMDMAHSMSAALLAALAQPASLLGHQVRVAASIGIACAPLHASFSEDLVTLADLALYESKRAGRARVTLFDDDFLKEERHRRFVERELRAAVLLDHLDIHYQPLTEASGRCIGVEALLRWNHPSLGSISPAEFIAVAERSTLIDRVGQWVFRRVCRDLPRLPGRTVCFNVSGAQLKRPEFIAMVREVIAETDADPRRLVCEITENIALGASRTVVGNLDALRALGIRVALDDFGTGYCSFQTLRSLPIDKIKLDRSYISTLARDPVSQVFVAAVCETARLLELGIVAEGVETEEEFLLAKTAGCVQFQGYWFARPMPLADLERWLAQAGTARVST